MTVCGRACIGQSTKSENRPEEGYDRRAWLWTWKRRASSRALCPRRGRIPSNEESLQAEVATRVENTGDTWGNVSKIQVSPLRRAHQGLRQRA